MSESADKSFAPTPSRLARARREGNLPRSQEFAANAAFAGAIVATLGTAPMIVAAAQECMKEAAAGRISAAPYAEIVLCPLGVLSTAAACAVIASLLQTGGVVFVAPALKFAKLAPVEGIKRMFSRETLTHALRALVAFSVASAAAVFSVRSLLGASAGETPVLFGALTWSAAVRATIAAAAVGALFAFVEFGVARRTWLSKLKMSLHELKRELKENDGDPLARQRRRFLHRSLIRGAISKVKEASFVVVNPTHVAVALKYDPPEIPVPMVLVRASDEMALRVRAVATEAKVPIIENVALARALFAQADVGDPIPAEHYVAIAEIVAQLVRSGVLQ